MVGAENAQGLGMRNFLLAAAFTGLTLGSVSSASAITFSGSVDAGLAAPTNIVETCSYGHSSDLGLCFTNYNLNFSLDALGDSTGWIDLFKVKVKDGVDFFTTQQSDIKVSFDFTSPEGGDVAEGNVSGYYTWFLFWLEGHVQTTWDNPYSLEFLDGTILTLIMKDLDIDCFWSNCKGAEFTVKGKFKLTELPSQSTSEVPLPTTLPLLMSGVMGFAYLGYRRRRAA